MSEAKPKKTSERALLLYRNLNLLGAGALFGIGVIVPPVAPAMNILAAIDIVQAGGAEAVRRGVKKKKNN